MHQSIAKDCHWSRIRGDFNTLTPASNTRKCYQFSYTFQCVAPNQNPEKLAGLRSIVGTDDDRGVQLLDTSVYVPNYEWRCFMSAEYTDSGLQPRIIRRSDCQFRIAIQTPQQILEHSLVQVTEEDDYRLLQFLENAVIPVPIKQKRTHEVPSISCRGAPGCKWFS